MIKNKIGFDEWRINTTIEQFLFIVDRDAFEVYDIRIHKDYVIVYTPIWQRMQMHRAFQSIELRKTTGMLGYVFRSIKKSSRVLAILLSMVLWYALSNTIFTIDIKGEQDKSRTLIQKTIQDMGYTTPFYGRDMMTLKKDLKKRLENDIAWLEISKQGSRYFITYTPKEFALLTQLGHNELIAQQDGVIARFDIAHGNKVRKVNDYVHAGDVLVSNVLEDSKGKNEEVFVEGRVYAYTWKDISVSMDKGNLPKSFQYFELLLQARSEVSKELRDDDRIYKENILQFSCDMGKIKMDIHYTLYKDVTTP